MHGGAKTKILEWGINLVCTVEVEDKHQFTVYSCVCMCDNERERERDVGREERYDCIRYMYLHYRPLHFPSIVLSCTHSRHQT